MATNNNNTTLRVRATFLELEDAGANVEVISARCASEPPSRKKQQAMEVPDSYLQELVLCSEKGLKHHILKLAQQAKRQQSLKSRPESPFRSAADSTTTRCPEGDALDSTSDFDGLLVEEFVERPAQARTRASPRGIARTSVNTSPCARRWADVCEPGAASSNKVVAQRLMDAKLASYKARELKLRTAAAGNSGNNNSNKNNNQTANSNRQSQTGGRNSNAAARRPPTVQRRRWADITESDGDGEDDGRHTWVASVLSRDPDTDTLAEAGSDSSAHSVTATIAPIPADSRISPGSWGHPDLCSRPCLYFAAGACTNGSNCEYCHLEHTKRPAHLDKRQRDTLRAITKSEWVALVMPILESRVLSLDSSPETTALVEQMLQVCDLELGSLSKSVAPQGQRMLMLTLRAMSVRALIASVQRSCVAHGFELDGLLEALLLKLKLRAGVLAAEA